jgi:hypothetical protein
VNWDGAAVTGKEMVSITKIMTRRKIIFIAFHKGYHDN